MQKVVCDRCGKEIDCTDYGKDIKIHVNGRKTDLMLSAGWSTLDLCHVCQQSLVLWFRQVKPENYPEI